MKILIIQVGSKQLVFRISQGFEFLEGDIIWTSNSYRNLPFLWGQELIPGGSRRLGGCESTTAISKNGEPALPTILTKLNQGQNTSRIIETKVGTHPLACRSQSLESL